MKILILGIGSAQVDLLKTLAGKHTIHALSYSAEGEGKNYADHFEIIDIKDKEAVLEYARKFNIELVCSVGSDLGMVTSAWVSQRVGLPTLVSPETATLCHVKNLFRQRLGDLEGNIEHKLLKEPSDIGNFSFPIIIKPIDSQGQRGVFLIRDAKELEDKFEQAARFSDEKKVIAEKYIEGPEISVNSYIVEGKIKFTAISDRIVWPGHAAGIIHKHRYPSRFVNTKSEHRIQQLISNVIKIAGIRNGPAYFQMKLKDDEPRLIEATPRLDGCHLWKLISYATGVDLLQTTVDHLMGTLTPNLLPRDIQGSWLLEFMCAKPGERVNLNKFELNGACYREWYYNNGDIVKPINNVMEKCGYQIYQTADAMEYEYSELPLSAQMDRYNTYYERDII